MKTIVITSGYFNPIHPGHIECFELCKELGDLVWVIVNNDVQALRKTGIVFQDEQFRMKIISSLKVIDHVILAIDKDDSVCNSIRSIVDIAKREYGNDVKFIFGKGGDRFVGNIPEVKVCNELNIAIKDGLGLKIDNSSTYRIKK